MFNAANQKLANQNTGSTKLVSTSLSDCDNILSTPKVTIHGEVSFTSTWTEKALKKNLKLQNPELQSLTEIFGR